MRLPLSVCNESFAWVGDIYVPPGTNRQITDEILAKVAEIEAAGEDITIEVHPDFQLVLTEENVNNWLVVRFLRYSQVKIKTCPFKEGMVKFRNKRIGGAVRDGVGRLTRAVDRILNEEEVPEPPYPEEEEEEEEDDR